MSRINMHDNYGTATIESSNTPAVITLVTKSSLHGEHEAFVTIALIECLTETIDLLGDSSRVIDALLSLRISGQAESLHA